MALKITRRKLIIGALALSLPQQSKALIHGSLSSLLKFNFIYDASWVSGAPASYQNALNSAASLLQAAAPNFNATINIQVGYGEFLGSTIPGNSSEGTDLHGASISYPIIRAALAAIPNPTASLSALLANTPAGSTLNTTSAFYVPNICCKALGLFGFAGGPTSAIDTTPDGVIGIGVSWSTAKLVGVFLHELTHAMGREAGAAPLCFSKFISVGNRDFSTNLDTAYFSLDGGTTKLADYDTTQDAGDWYFGAFQDGGTIASPNTSGLTSCFDTVQGNTPVQGLASADAQLLNSMGFQ